MYFSLTILFITVGYIAYLGDSRSDLCEKYCYPYQVIDYNWRQPVCAAPPKRKEKK